mmetsp:Transcript_1168/g.3980  ORF Transcript_1168/g.3980 Transcript_1168/m.3980 type:complete len:428 (-) Transcript_1168:1592-2875(-)
MRRWGAPGRGPRGRHCVVRLVSFLMSSPGGAPVAGHGGLTQPPPRNSFGQRPTVPLWPRPLWNATPAARAAMTAWTNYFDDGCDVGCDRCAHRGPDTTQTASAPFAYWPPAAFNCTVDGTPVAPGMPPTLPGADTLPPYARTWNMRGGHLNVSPRGDWGRFNPWRAPGGAAIANPCGRLCDGCVDPDDPTRPPGTNGTDLPPLSGPATVWPAGGTAEVAWALAVNHGGGCAQHPDQFLARCARRETLSWCVSSHSQRRGVVGARKVPIPTVPQAGWATSRRSVLPCRSAAVCIQHHHGPVRVGRPSAAVDSRRGGGRLGRRRGAAGVDVASKPDPGLRVRRRRRVRRGAPAAGDRELRREVRREIDRLLVQFGVRAAPRLLRRPRGAVRRAWSSGLGVGHRLRPPLHQHHRRTAGLPVRPHVRGAVA